MCVPSEQIAKTLDHGCVNGLNDSLLDYLSVVITSLFVKNSALILRVSNETGYGQQGSLNADRAALNAAKKVSPLTGSLNPMRIAEKINPDP